MAQTKQKIKGQFYPLQHSETEIIEVKQINEWKSALGQILVYSGFYSQHQKRLHLFGSAKELKAVPDVEAAVLSFAVKVTGEEV